MGFWSTASGRMTFRAQKTAISSVRAAHFRNWVTPDGSPGPSGEGGFAAESGRYHLYVSLACPWAHRTMIFRKLKALENVISLSIVSPHMGRRRLDFQRERRARPATPSTAKPDCRKSICSPIRAIPGRVSVPVLVGQKAQDDRQ